MEDDELFRQLAEDEGIQAAIAEHEAACTPKQGECIICKFFTSVHDLRHFADIFDSEKLLGLASNPPEFLSDSMAVIQFLSETCQVFLDNLEFFSPEDFEDEEDYEEEGGEDGE